MTEIAHYTGLEQPKHNMVQSQFLRYYRQFHGDQADPAVFKACEAALGHITAALMENDMAYLQDIWYCDDCRSRADLI